MIRTDVICWFLHCVEYKVALRDVVDLNCRHCSKLRRGNTAVLMHVSVATFAGVAPLLNPEETWVGLVPRFVQDGTPTKYAHTNTNRITLRSCHETKTLKWGRTSWPTIHCICGASQPLQLRNHPTPTAVSFDLTSLVTFLR